MHNHLLCLCNMLAHCNMIAKPEVGARKSHRQYDMDDKRHKSVDTRDATGSVAGQCDYFRAAI